MDLRAISIVAIRVALAMTFGAAGFLKLFSRTELRTTLAEFGTPARLLKPVALLLPWLELTCATAILTLAGAVWGAAGMTVLLLSFTVAIAANLALGRRPRCQCFGQLHSTPIGWPALARNCILAICGGIVVWQAAAHPDAGISLWNLFIVVCNSRYAVPGLVMIFGVQGIINVATLVHTMRQSGRVLLRLDALEGSGRIEARKPGLPVHSPAPEFRVRDIEGRILTSKVLYEEPNLLLVFTDPDCHACEALHPELARRQRDDSWRLRVVPVSRGRVEANTSKFRRYGIRDVLLQEDRETASAFLSEVTPSAVLVRKGVIASPLATGPNAIARLIETAFLPVPVHKGELVPPMQFLDLTGAALDLASVRRTLVIFWNPFCGFCANILAEVKAWEKVWPDDGPEWLIISSGGSTEDNEKQGFRSRVALDPKFASGDMFGAPGTPAAVLVDEEGRVASSVAFGGGAVLELIQRLRRGRQFSALMPALPNSEV